MKIDFTKVIEKLPDTKKAAREPVSRSRSKKPPASSYQMLGDVQRFEKFPDTVDSVFISLYRQSLDNFLVPYIHAGEMTISSAGSFIDNLVEQIFGNTKHFGIFSYLKERNYDNSAERELVRTCERLINSGWRVIRDKNTERYKIINSEGGIVIDATGPSEFSQETSAVTMDSSSAHVFIEGQDASKIEALATSAGQNADFLSSINSLDSLLGLTDDKKIHGIIINTSKLKVILSGVNSYQTLQKGVSFSDLYGSGYKLSDKMIFSHSDTIVMSDGKNEFVVYPVGSTLNQQHGASKDLLAVVASGFKERLFSSISGVTPQLLSEIQNLNRVIALISDYWNPEKTNLSYADMVDSFNRLDSFVKSGEISRNFYDRIFSNLAMIVATETILLGNNWLSLSSMSLDTISGKFYLYSNKDAFTSKISDITVIKNSATKKPKAFSTFTKSIYPFRPSEGNLSVIMENLPSEYLNALKSLDLRISGYPLKLEGVVDYMNAAMGLLLEGGE